MGRNNELPTAAASLGMAMDRELWGPCPWHSVQNSVAPCTNMVKGLSVNPHQPMIFDAATTYENPAGCGFSMETET
jgi:hypothetical protein